MQVKMMSLSVACHAIAMGQIKMSHANCKPSQFAKCPVRFGSG